MFIDNSREISDHIHLSDRFLILTHFNPDGDAIGSALGLRQILIDNDRKADFYMPHNVPEKYAKFAGSSVKIGELPDISSYSTIICVDFSSPNRANLPENVKLESLRAFIINIDHHPDNRIFGRLNLVNSATSAASEVILDFANFAGLKISPLAAKFLLIGILSDTGGFRFDNSNPKTMRSAAELIEKGVDFSLLLKELFFSKPLSVLRLEAEIIEKRLKIAFDGKFAYALLDEQIFHKHGLRQDETEGLIDIIRSINGTIAVAFIYENSDGYRISMRACDKGFSVGKIARKLGGGGHEMAAGAFINTKSASHAEEILLKHVEEELKQSVSK